LVTFEAAGKERFGMLKGEEIVELRGDVLSFLATGEKKQGGGIFKLKDVRLMAPVPHPGALRDFFAFEEHALQGAKRRNEKLAPEWYDQPVYYKGNHREIYGPGDTIPWPSYTRKLDFELEIAAVVGKKGRDLSPEQAKSHIAGYMIYNDCSARDIQKNEMVCRMGPAKGKDFANVFGPYLLTADELPEPENLKMSVKVNGEIWSEGDSSGRYWSFPTMLSHVSQGETVYPGDILGSGTYFKGCGLDMDRWIKPGDLLELTVEKLGTLKNTIGEPQGQTHLKYDKGGHVAHR
jgi:2-keto-4-pentenoate hydratase/2-oxohepta-3-ene-1,7-dioic acid hydratase in catechol pathway